MKYYKVKKSLHNNNIWILWWSRTKEEKNPFKIKRIGIELGFPETLLKESMAALVVDSEAFFWLGKEEPKVDIEIHENDSFEEFFELGDPKIISQENSKDEAYK